MNLRNSTLACGAAGLVIVFAGALVPMGFADPATETGSQDGPHIIAGSDGSALLTPSGIFPIGTGDVATVFDVEFIDEEGNPVEGAAELVPYRRVTLDDGTFLPAGQAVGDLAFITHGVLWNPWNTAVRVLIDDGESLDFMVLGSGQGFIIGDAEMLSGSHQLMCACKCGDATITVPCPQNLPDNNACGCENANDIDCVLNPLGTSEDPIEIHQTEQCTRIYVPVS